MTVKEAIFLIKEARISSWPCKVFLRLIIILSTSEVSAGSKTFKETYSLFIKSMGEPITSSICFARHGPTFTKKYLVHLQFEMAPLFLLPHPETQLGMGKIHVSY